MEEQAMSSAPQRKPIFTVIAMTGWMMFFASVAYGYFVYGEEQYRKGAAAGALPPSTQSNNPVISGMGMGAERTTIGPIESVGSEEIVVQIGGTPTRLRVTNQTEVVASQVEILPASEGAGGIVTEVPLALAQLKAGDIVQVTYTMTEQTPYTVSKIIRQ